MGFSSVAMLVVPLLVLYDQGVAVGEVASTQTAPHSLYNEVRISMVDFHFF